jgi:hypothetical protein
MTPTDHPAFLRAVRARPPEYLAQRRKEAKSQMGHPWSDQFQEAAGNMGFARSS